jgi:hypothetical protein
LQPLVRQAGIEDRLALVRRQPPCADPRGPVARDEVAGAERAKRRTSSRQRVGWM